MKRLSFCVLAIIAIVGLAAPNQAEARPNYLGVFKSTYDKLDKAKVDDLKCGVCHGGEKGANKKKLSGYAQEFGKALGGKNIKEEAKLKEAFKAAEKGDAGDGKTYGDLLKAGTLPKLAD